MASTSTCTSSNGDYCTTHIPKDIMTQLEAGAFNNLCQHLQERSDEVQNIDLMTLSGFCRNCLAKWLVLEARKLSTTLQENSKNSHLAKDKDHQRIVKALDALGYDEAAEKVYGCTYPEWKKRHSKKASDEQMKKFKESSPLHAKHDKSILKTRGEKPEFIPQSTPLENAASSSPTLEDTPKSSSLLSNVCCQDVDESPSIPTKSPNNNNNHNSTSNTSIQHTPLTSTPTSEKNLTPPPPMGGVNLKIGILTVSDRAFHNQYETGDLSGPAVENSIHQSVQKLKEQNSNTNSSENDINVTIVNKKIVPDDIEKISQTLKDWSSKNTSSTSCNLIFTTGGTGFAPRDVTPEATRSLLDRECHGLMSWASMECASRGDQIMAPLSRGTAGVCGSCMIVNLPGNPAGVKQVLMLVFPLMLHAVKDME